MAAVLDIELREAGVDQEASWELMAITWVWDDGGLDQGSSTRVSGSGRTLEIF